mmetsp:Transcript_4922/g.10580  ORF Transcript_4922/g.10580 Transcript_4922/m.10580 type:complete len:194 (+) Transcript_4922:51-632(+)|eukprot:CAMPEP_0202893674 /NCGR_PEP_ID=MMETSP1392-20130828/3217_1 /ASSEMBLY_ACC=CAM_ASM_000868 /TAXON_ID=225041 /ORGANISM="Chlamydomonas chlamydogama, Strain SAG 11-48b" /LENGTH=193 /DNA_ID=CAMNT_0049578099 /DNA_START=45 /DNA_END=626 /DNA_ORIENTATION=-
MGVPCKIAIVPGNGCTPVHRCNWYSWLQKQLHNPPSVQCLLKDMPDPYTAREAIWLPFMREQLSCDENTIIVGHSSGATAAVRYAEKYKCRGIVLVSAYTTDQGDSNERASGYFNRPWDFGTARSNCEFVVQFGSEDDPFLPWEEQQQVADGLGAELHRYTDRGHFMDPTFPELADTIRQKISQGAGLAETPC